MKPFAQNRVKLQPSVFQNAQQTDLKYILALDPDQLLAPYLIDAGLTPKAERYGNWESIGLDGHIGGHYLSALAMMYASTGEEELKRRLDYMISELARCQKANGNGYVGGIPQGKVFWERIHKGDIDGSSFGLNNTWVPLYNIHKLFAGLSDAYLIAGNTEAKKILIKLSDWFIELIRPLTDDQIQQILKTEHGGINETFALVYEITKDNKYLETSIKLCHSAILEPLIHKEDKLNGLHANTQIPKVIGFEKIAQITNNNEWSEAAHYFWENVSKSRSVAFGGNSVREHFNPANDFSSMLKSNQGPETCNSYNMLRLTKSLFLKNSDPSYLEFYERTLYNHILSSQHPVKGGFVYFTPIRPNHYRVYSQPNTSMWCCVGSGIENHSKYNELIYSYNENTVFVNLFIPSHLNWKEKGIQIVQNTGFPYSNESTIVINSGQQKKFNIAIRKPLWAEKFTLLMNGKVYPLPTTQDRYVMINKKWKKGDKITITFETKLRLENLPDGSNWKAFLTGPIVLAAKTSQADMPGLFADDSRMGHEAKGTLIPLHMAHPLIGNSESILQNLKLIKPLHYKMDSLTLQPFFEIHESRYQMYFQSFTENGYKELLHQIKKEEEEYLKLEAQTIDKVNCGEQQPEVDHNFKGEKSFSGNDEGKFWRSTTDYITYTLQDPDTKGHYIFFQFIEEINDSNTQIEINSKPLTNYTTSNNGILIEINNNKIYAISIRSKNKKPTSKIHQIRILK